MKNKETLVKENEIEIELLPIQDEPYRFLVKIKYKAR